MCGLLKKVEELVEEAKFGEEVENGAFDVEYEYNLLELDFVFDDEEAIGEKRERKKKKVKKGI